MDSDPGYDADASDSPSGSDSPTRSVSGDTTEQSSQSTGYHTPQAPQANTNTTSTPMQPLNSQLPVNEEDMDVDITGSSSSGGRGGREGTMEECGLLMDLYDLHNKTGRYLFSIGDGKRDFYKFWIEEEREFANIKELDEKIEELHERFLKNMDKSVDVPTDPVDADILRHSELIWGDEIDPYKETDENDDDQEQDGKDLDGVNSVDEDSKEESGGSNDLSSKGDEN